MNECGQSNCSYSFKAASHCPCTWLLIVINVYNDHNILLIKQIAKPVLTPDWTSSCSFDPFTEEKVETVVPMWLQLILIFVLNRGGIKINLSLFSTRQDHPKASVCYINRHHIVFNINFGITTLGLYLLHNNLLDIFGVYRNFITQPDRIM